MSTSQARLSKRAYDHRALYQSLVLEIQECHTFVEVTDVQISLGHYQAAERGLRNAERTYNSILRCSSHYVNEQEQSEIQRELATITAKLADLRSKFEALEPGKGSRS